jgi:hypothetical protein
MAELKVKTTLFVVSMLTVLIGGCGNSVSCRVKSYGPEYMTYSGDHNVFDGACRSAIDGLAYKIVNDNKSYTMPHTAEGCSSHKTGEDVMVLKSYFKTKDKDGFEYSITNVRLSGKEPFVVLETTNPDKYVLVSALMKEFGKRRIELKN